MLKLLAMNDGFSYSSLSPLLPVRALVAAGVAGEKEVSTFTFVIDEPLPFYMVSLSHTLYKF